MDAVPNRSLPYSRIETSSCLASPVGSSEVKTQTQRPYLAIAAGNCEGEGVRRGAGLCHGAYVSFISVQDHARNRLIHDLYAQRKDAQAGL
jgi:hypothetical protein